MFERRNPHNCSYCSANWSQHLCLGSFHYWISKYWFANSSVQVSGELKERILHVLWFRHIGPRLFELSHKNKNGFKWDIRRKYIARNSGKGAWDGRQWSEPARTLRQAPSSLPLGQPSLLPVLFLRHTSWCWCWPPLWFQPRWLWWWWRRY